MRAVERLVHGLEATVRLSGWIAAWTCVVLVLLVAGDVFMRYLFRVGAVWLQELQWHLISPIALFGMSYALYSGEQVRVDVLYERFPDWLRRTIEVFGGLALLAIALYAAWLTLPWIAQSWARNEGSPNPGGLPWRWALKSFIPLGFLLLALQSLAHALRHGFGLPPRGK
ncbi:TRAP transporter small permease subunit [Billgrantia desiderata]|uniref:TRAP transporter small permease protein n=1 Tax=Billgrantia desiderata TaxID=52021 RepID=A0ABS9B5A3_9GAMM|nr:TRAP transporter small permease subunit [Halomonas desiderata]MCE8013022.1 TRAP transporter small permease subunit [Halomonas desiderata]MCE8042675.1 TRAP transporter small permease subunit [Halomonas desiderata]MCE8047250.1 TRAP transporter small permease subunit [Halomonas desiderata]NIC39349.1 TRAP transporter small permease subunit [Halomonas desiderata]